jgi:hypothetical protein
MSLDDADVALIRQLIRDELRAAGLMPTAKTFDGDLVLSPGPAWDAYIRRLIAEPLDALVDQVLAKLAAKTSFRIR